MDWMQVTGFVVMTFGITLGIRNYFVFRERMRVIDLVARLNKQDIHLGLFGRADARFDALREVTYNQMLYQFWKPVKSFYAGHKCLQENL